MRSIIFVAFLVCIALSRNYTHLHKEEYKIDHLSLSEFSEKIVNSEFLLYCGDSNLNSQIYQVVFEVGSQNISMQVYQSNDSEVCDQLVTVKQQEFISLLNAYDQRFYIFNGTTSEELLTFVEQYRYPAISELNSLSYQRLFEQHNNGILLFTNKDNEGLEQFKEVAFKYRTEFVFITLFNQNDNYKNVCDYFGVKHDVFPQVMIVQEKNEAKKFLFKNELTVDNLVQFVEDYKNGKVDQHKKSEEYIANNQEDVQTIVRNNFNEIVLDSQKDVLLEFYEPQCSYCKEFEPTYNQLAQQLKNAGNNNIVIAKVNIVLNEIDNVRISEVPSIYFYKNGQKDQPVQISFKQELSSLLQFLKENTSFPWLEIPDQNDKETIKIDL